MPLTSASGPAAIALLAATTLPSLLGGRGAGTTVEAHAVEPAAAGKDAAAISRSLPAPQVEHATAAARPSSAPSPSKAAAATDSVRAATASHRAAPAATPAPATNRRSAPASHTAAPTGHTTEFATLEHATDAHAASATVRAPATTAAVTSDTVHAPRSATMASGGAATAGPAAPPSKTPAAPTHAASEAPVRPRAAKAAPTHRAAAAKTAAHSAVKATPTTAPGGATLPMGGITTRPGSTPMPAPTIAKRTPTTTKAAPTTTKAATPPVASNLTGVRGLQARLHVPVDGDFGPVTLAAVETFQRAHGLTPDGVVDASTRAALGLGPGPVLREAAGYGDPTTPTTTTTTTAPTTAAPTGATLTAPTGGSSEPTPTPATGATAEIAEMIGAGNEIATTPYVYGGGHGSFNSIGYDCSGSVSYVLHAAGLLSTPEDSTQLESYGAPGPGRYVTIYANAGHAWMTIDGRRFDTVALQETGTRWSSSMASTAGYVVRHPVGL
jgi:peptidoglycan hydrolase-like protein with peptidoglycan-binding domain